MDALEVKIFLILLDLHFACAQNVYASECFYDTIPSHLKKMKLTLNIEGENKCLNLTQTLDLLWTRLTEVLYLFIEGLFRP